jgi:polyferredoxin
MLNSELIIGGFTAALIVVTYFASRDLSKLGGIFVNYILAIMSVLTVIVVIKGFVKPERIKFFESAAERNNIIVGLLILLLYLIFLPLAGFLLSSYAFYFVFNLYLADDRFSRRNILQSAGLTFVVVTGFYLIFHHFLEVPLPTGSWFE